MENKISDIQRVNFVYSAISAGASILIFGAVVTVFVYQNFVTKEDYNFSQNQVLMKLSKMEDKIDRIIEKK